MKITHFRDQGGRKKKTSSHESCIDSYITYYICQQDKSDILHVSKKKHKLIILYGDSRDRFM